MGAEVTDHSHDITIQEFFLFSPRKYVIPVRILAPHCWLLRFDGEGLLIFQFIIINVIKFNHGTSLNILNQYI